MPRLLPGMRQQWLLLDAAYLETVKARELASQALADCKCDAAGSCTHEALYDLVASIATKLWEAGAGDKAKEG